MSLCFHQLSDFDRGVLYRLLSDAYSFNPRYEEQNRERWLADEQFFFDQKEIGDRYCTITTLDDEPIGFVAWDPRNMPEYAIIGDNCIASKHKGKGYGREQLQAAVERMIQCGAKRIYVSTDNELIPAQRMYERVGFQRLDPSVLAPWQIEQHADIYYVMET